MKTYCLLIGLIFALPALADAQSAAPLRLVRTIPLPNVKGRLDHMDVDVKGKRLFVAGLENGSVEVVDLGAGKWVRSIPGFQKPQGIAYVESLNKLFVASGDDGMLRVTAGHEQFVQRLNIRDALRLLKPRDAPHPLPRPQIHDFYRAILKSRNEEPLALHIHIHMIEAPLYVGQRNRSH